MAYLRCVMVAGLLNKGVSFTDLVLDEIDGEQGGDMPDVGANEYMFSSQQ